MGQLLSFALFLFVVGISSFATALSASGVISMKVVRALLVEAKEPLNFSTASPGAEPSRVEPGEANSGKFIIRGEPNTAFQIRLPSEATLVAGQGHQENQKITVHSFTSFPANHGSLTASGEQVLLVGATRDAIRMDQEEGTYAGAYSIDIIY